MTDRERIRVLRDALHTLSIAEMGEPTLYAKVYEEQVREMARTALVDAADTTPQD
jgi:hypothetical protein